MVSLSDPPIEKVESWVGNTYRIPDAEFEVTGYRKGSSSIVVEGIARSQYGAVKRIHAAYYLERWL